MKIIVVGCGSIGIRHLKNLFELGHELYAVDKAADKLKEAALYCRGSFVSLESALPVKPEAALICTYSNEHIKPALRCAREGVHLFIEKPLSLDMEGIDGLLALLEEKRIISLVGCNMRFHPAVRGIYDILNSEDYIGSKIWAGLEFGYFLPFAKDNYESSYMANKQLGGNLIFDVIHELDYAVWFFGRPAEVFCEKGRLSGLKMDTDDAAEIIIKFKSGMRCVIHLDYLQHGYSRRCKVVCENATILWDFASGKIGMIRKEDREWKWTEAGAPPCYNQMYVDEMKHFLNCVMTGTQSFNSVRDSLPALKLAVAAEKSAASGKWEKISE